jgi:hypothetical protein
MYLQTEAVVFPANARTSPRARYAWERQTFAVANRPDDARPEEAPGYYAPPDLEKSIQNFLREVLHVPLEKARALPYSEADAKVGKRASRHPLHDTYIDKDSRATRESFYEKSPEGMLVADIDQPEEATRRGRKATLFEETLPRVQRVFTTPLPDLLQRWSNTAQQLRSGPTGK